MWWQGLARALIWVVVLAGGLGAGLAQQLVYGVETRVADDGSRVVKSSFVLERLREGPWRVDLRVAAPPEGPLELGFGGRTTTSFGPIGNLTFRGRLDVDTSGAFEVTAAGEGVIGGVAGRAQLVGFNVDPGHFQPEHAALAGSRARYLAQEPPARFGIELKGGLTYRLTRTLIADVDAAAAFVDGRGFGLQLPASLRIAGLHERDDGVVLLSSQLTPGAAGGYVAAGFEYRLNRPGAPPLRAALLAGIGSNGAWPGARFSVLAPSTRPEPPMRYGVEIAIEPYRTDVPTFRGSGFLAVDVGGGEARLRAVSLWPDAGDLGVALLLTYQLPL